MRHDLRPRLDVLNIPTSDDLAALFVSTQCRASRILAHGAADRSELDQLARMCDLPTHVVRLEMAEVA